MKLRSFRLRIALLSATLAGGALVGFGGVSWWWIYQANVNRLDAKLEAWLSRPPVKDRLQSDETALHTELGIDAETPIALLVLNSDGKTVYRSKHWPADLNLQGLWPPPPPPPSPSPGPPPDERRHPPSSRTEPLFPEEPPFPPESPPDVRPRPPKPKLVTQHTAAGTWHVGMVVFPDVKVAIAISLQAIDRQMAVISDVFLISIPILLLLVAGGAWGLSGSALHPIRQLSVAIQQVTVTGLERRVPIGATDVEFLELIQVFNQMLERLERSFKQASRFSGDAAHELKTPLAILQGDLDRTLQQAQPGSELHQSLR
ncbi:MAG TPA: HAMP domain-containing protein, partial [Allocoleopsis sp.]